MPLATALELVLNEYGIYDAQNFIDVMRETPQQLADFLERDDNRALLAASAGTAHVKTQTDTADADVEPMVEAGVAEAMVAEAIQIGDELVAREVAARHAAEERAVHAEQRTTSVAADAQTMTDVISTANASTCHYLVVGVGLAHAGSQVEHNELEVAAMNGDLTLEEAHWMRGHDASEAPLEAQEQEDAAENVAPPLAEESPPPPVFADCSHYTSTSSSKKPVSRRSKRCLKF